MHHPWRAPAELLEEGGIELGFNYPLPIVTMEESKQDVMWANSVILRCCSTPSGAAKGGENVSGSGGENNQSNPAQAAGGSSEGTDEDARINNNDSGTPQQLSREGMGPLVGSSSDHDTLSGPGVQQGLVPQHKQPYRPPTDPALQAQFLKVPGGSGGISRKPEGMFEVLQRVTPDVGGLRLPEHLYKR